MNHCTSKENCIKKRRTEENDQCPYVDDCKLTCPGIRQGCSGGKKCPRGKNCSSQKSSAPCGRFSKDEDQCVSDCKPILPITIEKIVSCSALQGCATPIIINTANDQCNPRTDLKIQLYIHQLPPTQEKSSGSTGVSKDETDQLRNEGGVHLNSGSKEIIQREIIAEDDLVGESSTDPPEKVIVMEPRLGIEKKRQLESAPPKSIRAPLGHSLEVKSTINGMLNIATDTEEDSKEEHLLIKFDKGTQ
ncbi:hypothetical protein HHI36_014791 [Cryptolaemus montrouzieri]